MKQANKWVSDYGIFDIPDEVYEQTKWEYWEDDKTIVGVLPIADNHLFFSWLHQKEVEAGKESPSR